MLVTFAVWAHDAAHISENRRKPLKPTNASLIGIGTVLATFVLFAALWLFKINGSVPEGLFEGTLWISLSAITFLYLVTTLRRKFDQRRRITIFSPWF
jgi:uncharacterized membrane protein (GlpM family)